MNPIDQSSNTPSEPSLPLPEQHGSTSHGDEPNPAVDLVRKKVEAAYANEPDVEEELLDAAEPGKGLKRSKYQDYIYSLTNSGKSLAEIQAAWHEYYAGLTDAEKHQVWREFYSAHAQASAYAAARPTLTPESEQPLKKPTPARRPRALSQRPTSGGIVSRTLADIRDYTLGTVNTKPKLKPMQHFRSLLFGLGVGSVVMLIFLFSFFNERFIAPFIQPSRNSNNTPIIASDTASGPNPEIIIPKINVEIPVVYDVNTIDSNTVETALERGVVHYADTALPGQNGNVVIVGHSSNNIFNPGQYKFAFVLLSHLDNGDTFYLQKDGKRYTYQVYEKEIVKPTDVSVLAPADKPAVASLITCDPPGTSTNRLVVVGQQISPSTNNNAPQTNQGTVATQTAIIPGNSPSLWSRFTNWLKH